MEYSKLPGCAASECGDHDARAPDLPRRPAPRPQRRYQLSTAIVPCTPAAGDSQSSSHKTARAKLGALQVCADPLPAVDLPAPLPSHWRAPSQEQAIDRQRAYAESELGTEVTSEIRRWLIGRSSGHQCAHVVLDRALTVMLEFKLASDCDLELLCGPLGAIIGGYVDATWLYTDIFERSPENAVCEAFKLLGFEELDIGDWSRIPEGDIVLAYQRVSLWKRPNRGGALHDYLKLLVATELVWAFAGKAGPLDSRSLDATAPGPQRFVLGDRALLQELQRTPEEAVAAAGEFSESWLRHINRAFDEYILRQMRAKNELMSEISRCLENSSHAILGISADATDTEIKKAYRAVAMQLHPDKGGSTEEFQDLNTAYARIMEQRRNHIGHSPHTPGTRPGKESSQPHVAPPSRAAEKTASEECGDKSLWGNFPGKCGNACDAQVVEGLTRAVVDKVSKAADEAAQHSAATADFARQAVEAAENTCRCRDEGATVSAMKSSAQSAIINTLRAVKAARAVAYSALDVASGCRDVAKHVPTSNCLEQHVVATGMAQELLNVALACAVMIEATATELRAATLAAQGDDVAGAVDRFIVAADDAARAGSKAAHFASEAAGAALAGSEECCKASEATAEPSVPAPTKESVEAASPAASDVLVTPSPEEAKQKLLAKHANKHKALNRLNAELLTYQQDIWKLLCSSDGAALIPAISIEEKRRIFTLLRDYLLETHAELEAVAANGAAAAADVLAVMHWSPMLIPFLSRVALAIPISFRARLLRMASLQDVHLARRMVEEHILTIARNAISKDDLDGQRCLDELSTAIQDGMMSLSAGEPSCDSAAVPATR